MKKQKTTLKAFALSLAMAFGMLFPTTMNAQSDGFFRGGMDNYENRDASIDDNIGGGITNDGFGAPLGSGLLIMVAAGAGYALARRKRSHKGMAMFLAIAMFMGLTQCKKEQTLVPANSVKTVNITLKVGGNGGSRHDINTTTGAVDFQDGDVIYVGNGSTYIGTLTKSGENFSGDINEPTDGTEIYFFFVGGLPTTPADLSGKSSFTVDISDQSNKMPVLSCNHVTYTSGTTSYSCVLQNQCALVKFTTASGTDDPVHVGGLYTGATINFGTKTPGITNNGTTGFVALNSKSETEKWAVLLPQTGFSAEAAVAHVGYAATIPTIEADDFITGDAAISISTPNNIIYLNWLTSDFTAQNGNILTGTLAGNYRISIADGATVTLNGVTINRTGNLNHPGINCNGDVTIILADGTTNTVRPMRDRNPAIYIASGKTLTIKGGELGTGSLTATNPYQYGAGIGSCGSSGYTDNACGNIVIEGGNITAQGGSYGAGIGAGSNGCGNITITGGTVTASSSSRGAGIGGGSGSSCGTITIENTVTLVTATKGSNATNSIGRGYGSGSKCGTVTIGGTVYWNGSAYQNGGDTYLRTSPLVYPAPTPAEATVTWINSQIQTIILGNGEGEIYQGIGVQLDESSWYGTDVYLSEGGMITFQIDSDGAYAEYDIKKIEIYYSSFSGNLPEGGGWSNDGSKLTWDDGLNWSVILQHEGPDPDHMSIAVTQVVFTLQKSTK